MIAGGDKLQSVADELSAWAGDRAAVQRAAETYWSAAYHAPEWPEPLRDWHERINSILFSQGVARHTIARMTAAELAQLVGELASFAREALHSHSPV